MNHESGRDHGDRYEGSTYAQTENDGDGDGHGDGNDKQWIG